MIIITKTTQRKVTYQLNQREKGGLLRVWEPGTCVLGFDGFQPPTPTFNGTHQSREIQAEGNFFAMFASSGIVA